MEKIANQENIEKVPNLIFSFSVESEIQRLVNTKNKIKWYKEQEYNLTLPEGLDLENASIESINNAISLDFDVSVYEKMASELKEGLSKEMEGFIKNLLTLGLPVQEEYIILLTRYGVGGSYGLPNKIQINFNYGYHDPVEIIFHEIIHLTIEQLIRDNNIEHWTKERLVDLIFSNFFQKNKAQRDPENAEEIRNIFERYFPDIKKVITELSKSKVYI